jgi:hypothetical protein
MFPEWLRDCPERSVRLYDSSKLLDPQKAQKRKQRKKVSPTGVPSGAARGHTRTIRQAQFEQNQCTEVFLVERYRGLEGQKRQRTLQMPFRTARQFGSSDYHPFLCEATEIDFSLLKATCAEYGCVAFQELNRSLISFLKPLSDDHIALAIWLAKEHEQPGSTGKQLSDQIIGMSRVREMLEDTKGKGRHCDKYALISESLLYLCVDAVRPRAIVQMPDSERPLRFLDFFRLEDLAG